MVIKVEIRRGKEEERWMSFVRYFVQMQYRYTWYTYMVCVLHNVFVKYTNIFVYGVCNALK